jgi:hypothetical protein
MYKNFTGKVLIGLAGWHRWFPAPAARAKLEPLGD